MPDTFTTNLNLDQPEVGGDDDVWGTSLNDNLAIIDALFAATGTGTVVRRDASNRGTATGFVITNAAGDVRTLDFETGTELRWQLGVTDDAESGGNAGSNFELIALADDGETVIADVFTVARATGVLDFASTPTVGGTNNVWSDANGPTNVEAITGLWTTGDVKLTIKTTADSGWLMCSDQTIGNVSSGAAFANTAAQALYTLLWTNVSNTYAPVTGGRGSTPAADWAAQKSMQLTALMGRAIGIAGSGAGLTARALGQTFGEENHLLAVSEMPSHTHGITDPGHSHTYNQGNTVAGGSTNGAAPYAVFNAQEAENSGLADTDITINAAGGGSTHNNVQPTTFLNAMIKL
ncbi:MAG: hypothetical protein WB868_21570 [Xanthobacteraceae bacterium]